ncbi:unnamed protein product [Spodoptera littoralis]|uniref:CHK kinase-like domain-containing protein n=1 Tax=Spodoptera littoralis TaxID=7109 RepID=A0A9P0HVZ6_SPOLI|nr:unnamed protein product [Spodoptera littoralis]CAH1634840.1 unnamed protein product [Spodoptera littoralis]
MARYNFEGNFANLSDRQAEFINEVIRKQDLNVNKVVFHTVGKADDNFMADVKRIGIEGDKGSMKMIVKIASANENVREFSLSEYLFGNEHFMYMEVLPKFVSLQKEAGVPEEEQLKYAKCYGSLNEAPNEVVILEDLNESNFKMLNKFESLSDECVRSILKNFAILHSLSFVLKYQEPETYEAYKEKLHNVWNIRAGLPGVKQQFQSLENLILSTLDKEEYRNVIKNTVTCLPENMLKASKLWDNPYSIIQQGDAWTNNIMFKFDGDELQESIMIDYQLSKVSSPVIDLLYMTLNCTDYEIRTKNFYSWLDYYHSELDKSLSYFDLKADLIYPRDQLDADIKTYIKLLLPLSFMLANLLMRDANEAAKMKEAMVDSGLEGVTTSMVNQAVQNVTLLRTRKKIEGLIDSVTELGLLDN